MKEENYCSNKDRNFILHVPSDCKEHCNQYESCHTVKIVDKLKEVKK